MEYADRGARATKLGFGQGVLDAAEADSRVCGLGADITSSVSMDLFANRFPERFFSLGIAEQNAMGVAAGLALSGKLPVFSTYAVFAAHRAADQIRLSVCYNDLHVVIGGAHAGISVGPDGATHQALEDISALRALPGITILSPSDATQARLLTKQAILGLAGPVYIRFGRAAVPDFSSLDEVPVIGKGRILREGTDLCLVATGHMVWQALKAAELLEERGVRSRVVDIHTIKPIDGDLLVGSAERCRAVVSVEEHQVTGGLGSAVAEVLSRHRPTPLLRIGVADRFGGSGHPDELLLEHGLDALSIAGKAYDFLRNNKAI